MTLWLIMVGLLGSPAARADDPLPASPPVRPGPTAIILEPPADRDALLAKLRRPDLLIAPPAGLGSGREMPASAGAGALSGVVGSVRVVARVVGTEPRARVDFTLGVTVSSDELTATPVALDGLVFGRVAEAGRDLKARSLGEGRGWEVELLGRGEHQVELSATAPVRARGEGRGLDLAIPPAGITQVELHSDRPLAAAQAGADEPLTIEPGSGEVPGSRAVGHLSPRGRLDLTWRAAEAAAPLGPTILAARGEVAVAVSLDALEVRETWTIAAVRGSTREASFRLDADEEVVQLGVAGRPVAVDRRPSTEPGVVNLVVALPEPLGAPAGAGTVARPATITLTTRRPRPPDRPGGWARFALTGHPIGQARSQAGVIGVARPEVLLVTPAEGKGVRRVDPRTDLPDAFRGRPDAWLGFEFTEQPFDLGLQVEAIPPRFEIQARSTVTLAEDQAEVTTTLAGRVWQGRLFEFRVLAPPGLVFQPTEPTPGRATVRSDRKWPRPGPSSSAEALTVTFATPVAAGEAFSIPLRGTFAVGPDGPAAINLFQPLGAALVGTEVALVAARTRWFEAAETGATRFFPLKVHAPPADWPWPPGMDPASVAGTATWLRGEGSEAVVPALVVTRPRVVHHRSSMTAEVDRGGVDVVVELAGEVVNGTIAGLDVALPPEVPDRWVAEAGEGLDREARGLDPATGWRRYRLRLPEPVATFQAWIRYRLDCAPDAGGKTEADFRFRVQPIRVDDGVTTGHSVRLAGAGDVAVHARAPGWRERPAAPARPADSVQKVRQVFDHAGPTAPEPIEVVATPGKVAELPTLVASRLWIRSRQLHGGALATSAYYRLEGHARSVVLRLPRGSRWVRGAAGAAELAPSDVELAAPDTYRITLPPAVGLGPVAIQVDSIQDEDSGEGNWTAPELVGGVVQQTAWELSLLGTRAGVGIPAGWTDENVWYREGVLWKRRPRRTEGDLIRWVHGGLPGSVAVGLPESAAGSLPEPDEGGEGADWTGNFVGGRHSYLFGHSGPPVGLDFPTWSRSTLLLVCSGPILLVGLLILARRPPPRPVAAALLVLGFLFVALVEPNTGLLVIESSSLGLALAGIAAVIHQALDRRGRRPEGADPSVALAAADWADPSRLAVTSLSISTTGSITGQSGDWTVVGIAATPPGGGSTGEFPIPTGLDPDPGVGMSFTPEAGPEQEEGRP